MADVNLYFFVEDLNLTAGQRQTLIDQLKAIGRRDDAPNPKDLNHWRIRPDNRAVIYEAWFDEDHLTAIGMRDRLASIFGVAPATITFSTTQTAYGPAVTYTHSAQQKLRLGVFGGVSASYQQSQAAVQQFLRDNAAAWGDV
jgi:hypothetical protein